MEYLDGPDHCGLMLAARITFAHFSVSSAMNLPKSAGLIDFGTLPMPANSATNLGSASPASIASWSLSMIAAEKFAGEMNGASNAGRRHIDLTGTGFGVGYQLRDALGGKRRVDHQDKRRAGDAGDRRGIADEIEFQIVVE